MRHEKQIAVPKFGIKAQKALEESTIAIIGCGALGSLQAEMLVRMGAKNLRIADGDHVTIGNIHRQLLFTEAHAEEKRLKVEAAKEELLRINRNAEILTKPRYITSENIDDFINGADIVLDAVDDVEARFLTNDSCLKAGIPWIYTGVAGSQGMIMPVIPGEGPCLRCLYPHPPEKEDSANCANSGILPMTVTMAVSMQLTQAIKILTGEAETGTLIKFDCMEPKVRKIRVPVREGCACRDEYKTIKYK
ncbi:MAG: HesA/MoeB/ThiF family protein [Kiritimatiellae bacterium]|jgi:molybdopterin/thiamine biosynthesis adenylyltransferase|nr:HesA/MoeB/ThiF family protein [Kiritimatiellia bacterium]